MKTAFDYLLARLSENSTWRGVILLATACGVKMAPAMQDQIVATGLSLVGIINILRKG